MRKNFFKFGIVLFVLTLLVLTPRENSLSVKQKEYSDPNDNVEISAGDVSGGKFRVSIKNFTKSVNNVNIAVWSDKNGQDDLVWENAKKDENGVYYLDVLLKDHKFDEGNYCIHVYYNDTSGWIGATSLKDVTINKGNFSFNKIGNTKYEVSLNDSDYIQDNTVEFAVWSDKGGQDDIVWYKANNSNGKISYTIPLTNHKTKGKYLVHVYGHDRKGTPVLLTWTEFVINPPKVDSSNIITPVFDPETNVFTVSVKNIESDTGIKSVQIPVWSDKNGQDDLVWYNARYDNADNSWKVDVNVGDHDGKKDVYYAHIYVTTEIGMVEAVGATSVSVEPKKALTAIPDPDGKGFKINYANHKKYKNGTLSVAVWSDKNGQDDLEWYTLKNGNYEGVFSDHLGKNGVVDPGTYFVHLYIYDKNGKFVDFDSTSFEVLNPQTTTFTTTEMVNGKFKVLINNVSSKFNKIQVPIWSDVKGQDDIIWYTAKKVGVGSYEVEVDVKNHKFSEGKYCIEAYMYGANNKFSFLHISKDITINKGEIKPEEDVVNNKDTYVQVSLRNSDFYGHNVKFAVWSEKNGQDDIVWYNAVSKDGKITYNIPIKNHKSSGKYNVHIYAYDSNGNPILLNYTTFEISDITFNSNIEVVDVTGSRDDNVIYRVKISNINSVSGVKSVKVPVWSDEKGQDDIVWYNAVYHSEDNTYTVDVKPGEHKYSNGKYNTHVYVTGENGVEKAFAQQEDFKIDLKPKVVSNKASFIGNGKWRVHIVNTPSNVKEVSVPTWSESGGQDDIVWYKAKKQGDGSFIADIKEVAHYPFGKMFTDVYVYYTNKGEFKISLGEYQIQNSYHIQPTYYSQHNGSWGGVWFGSWQMGSTGCVPTSLAMALNPIVGNVDPYATASYLFNHTNSFNKFYAGAGGNAFPTTTEAFGSDYLGLHSPDEVRRALRGGAVVVALVGKGHFVGLDNTTHAIVLYGLNGDTPNIYDPYTLGGRPWYVSNVSIDTLWNERSRNVWDNENGSVFHMIF